MCLWSFNQFPSVVLHKNYTMWVIDADVWVSTIDLPILPVVELRMYASPTKYPTRYRLQLSGSTGDNNLLLWPLVRTTQDLAKVKVILSFHSRNTKELKSKTADFMWYWKTQFDMLHILFRIHHWTRFKTLISFSSQHFNDEYWINTQYSNEKEYSISYFSQEFMKINMFG
jgi:hypothetical protein